VKKLLDVYGYEKYGYTMFFFVRIIAIQTFGIVAAMVLVPVCLFGLLTILFPVPTKLIKRFKNRGEDNVKRGNNN